MIAMRFLNGRVVKSLGMIAVAAVALTACRAEEQGRMIRYEPGVYKGKPDNQLSDAQLGELRARTRSQAGVATAGFAGGAAPKASDKDVRPPNDLKDRALKQGGAK